MQKKLFLIFCITYKIAADGDKDSRTSEDNYALRWMSSETSSKNRTKRSVEMDVDNNSRSNEDNFVLEKKLSTKESSMIKKENEQYEIEKKQGDMANLFGSNQHHIYPDSYKDLGRRFVLQYPYKEALDINDDEEAEINFDYIAKNYGDEKSAESYLIPIRASPELVLAVAAKAAFLEAMNPHNHLEENLINKESLRSGNYWNGVWREDINPDVLRTQKEKVAVEPIKLKVMPGTELYKLVSELKKISPRLIYVINKK